MFNNNKNIWLMLDGVHPNVAGCQAISQTIYSTLQFKKPEIHFSSGKLSTQTAFSYQWYHNNQIIPEIEGGTQQTLTPQKSGIYSVQVQLNNSSFTTLVSLPYEISL